MFSDPTQQPVEQGFIIVCHSLGSYLIFSALDINQTTIKTTTVQQSGNRFEQVLERTSMVFFFANQLRLLELASLDGPTDRNLATHLESWGKLRCDYLKSKPGASQGYATLRALPRSMIKTTCSPGQFPTFLASK